MGTSNRRVDDGGGGGGNASSNGGGDPHGESIALLSDPESGGGDVGNGLEQGMEAPTVVLRFDAGKCLEAAARLEGKRRARLARLAEPLQRRATTTSAATAAPSAASGAGGSGVRGEQAEAERLLERVLCKRDFGDMQVGYTRLQ
jgi:hypothetical protein